MRFNSLRFKISVLFTVILFAVLSMFGAFLIGSVKYILFKDLDRDLIAKSIQIEAILNAYAEIKANENHPAVMFQNMVSGINLSEQNRKVINRLWYADVKALNIQYDYFRLVSASGRTILMSEKFPIELSETFDKPILQFVNQGDFLTNIYYKGKRYRFMTTSFVYSGKMPLVLQIATPLERVDRILLNFSGFMFSAIIFIVLAAIVGGRIFADKILNPIINVINTADSITHKDLSVRIKQTSKYEEMKTLIRSFNVMVERLERSFNHINEFSSHAAHELKTPLTIMKGELELAIKKDQNHTENNIVLQGLIEEVDKLILIIKDMLLLAKLDYDTSVFNFEKIDLKLFFNEIYEQSLVLADAKGIKLHLTLPERAVKSSVDKVHLKRLFFNLINNAMKYTPKEGTIDINVSADKKEIIVDIVDTGEGISRENLKKIFDKFFRTRNDNSNINVGLGLNIAQSIARAHQGEISVKSQVGRGSTFTVRLPIVRF